MIENIIRKRADILTILVGIFGVVFVFTREAFLFAGPAIGIFAAGMISVLFPKSSSNIKSYTVNNVPNFTELRSSVILLSTYIICYLIIHYVIYMSQSNFYYVLYGLYFAIIGYRLMNGVTQSLIIIEILVVSSGAYISPQLLYPAGVLGLDMAKTLPAIERILSLGYIPHSEIAYGTTPAHLVYVAQSSEITGLSIISQYKLLSYIPLFIGIVVISSLHKVVQEITKFEALIASAVFSTVPFTLRSAIHVDKLTFFIAPTAILVYCIYQIYNNKDVLKHIIILHISFLYILFGHPYSTGAAALLMVVPGGYIFIYQYSKNPRLTGRKYLVMLVTTTIIILFFSTGIAGLIRIIELTASLLASTFDIFANTQKQTSTATGGVYSSSTVLFLLLTWIPQFILFTLGISGCIYLIKNKQFNTDLPVVTVFCGFIVIILGVITGDPNFIPQRFIWLITLFGLNIGFAVSIINLSRLSNNYNKQIVGICLLLLSISALLSPVAGIAFSPVASEVPHAAPYNTHSGEAGEEWTQVYGTENFLSEESLPIVITNSESSSALVNISSIPQSEKYIFREKYAQAGILISSSGPGLGTRIRVFVDLPECVNIDNNIYSNGGYSVYERSSQNCYELHNVMLS